MTNNNYTQEITFGQTIYSIYCYGFRWWGSIANEILDRVHYPYESFGSAYRTAKRIYDGGEGDLDDAIANMHRAENRLLMAIARSGMLSNPYFITSLPFTSTGRKVGLLEIIKRLQERRQCAQVA